ncbi:MAG: DUF3990 domain-containing protein [Fusobacteriaceae bacterium]|jgi:hypothetical protein|nr:DUF3990 domain-containing protein [Fusobacteriaceae bacterium]
MLLYHGSRNIIKQPVFGTGNSHNDYGLGFYCTESIDLAKEWACTEETNGYANKYEIDLSGLTIINLSSDDYNILNWLALLVNNRTFRITSDIATEGKQYLTKVFLPDTSDADIIVGYRANDSYFSFANAFLNNALSFEQLSKAMVLGKLGMQTVLKSKRAFGCLRFKDAISAEKEVYYPSRAKRDLEARQAYRTMQSIARAADSIYLIDILRGGWKNDDARLRRNISE